MPTNVLVLNKSWVVTGAGAPEGQHAAPIGSLYLREEGTVGTSVYVKESGVGATGWRALGAPAVPPTRHAATHEPGGTDTLTLAAWTDRSNEFLAQQQITATTPLVALVAAGGQVDTKRFDLAVATDGTRFAIQALTDDAAMVTGSAQLDRGGSLVLTGALTTTALDLTEGVPLDPPLDTARLYALDVNGYTQVEMRDGAAKVVRFASDNILIAKVTVAVTRGQCVYLVGASGANPLAGLARANDSATMPAVGLALDSGAINAFIRVLVAGTLQLLDTSAFAEGDRLYVSPTTAGSMTTTLPVAPNFAQRVGFVTRSHATQGEVLVLTTAVAGDPRLHHATHEPGGSDALVLSAASRLLGRGAAGAGAMEEIVLGTGLTMSGTTLNASGGGANAAYTTVANVFTASPQRIQVSGEAGLELRDLSKPVNERSWWMSTVGGNLWFSACTDADGVQKLPLILHRTGNATIVGSVLVGRDTNSDSVIIGVGGALAKVHLQVAAGNDFWIGRNIVWRNGPWESDDPSLSSSFLGFTSGGDLNYYTAPAGNPPAYTVRLTLQASNGELSNSGPLKVATNISSGYYLYPGAVTAPGTYQTSWYLGAHSSYGLYTNTGLYVEGGLWPSYIEARAHIRAAAGLYDYARGTAIGGWIAYAAGAWGESTFTQGGTDAVYMLIGNTCFVKYEVNATLHAAMTYVYVYLPVTVARRMDAIGFAQGPFTGTVHCYTPAGGNYVVMHRATTHPYDLSYFQAGAYTFLFQMFVQF